ncbi:MAG: head-tail connector protein [Hyphomonadaceae bacterium]|nr:head-tail connector protein [Hyphomonadaceae bacterium]
MARYPNFELVTAPIEEPVTLAEAKEHCTVEHAEHDDMITRMIAAARRHIESQYGLALVTQTHKATVDAFPESGLKLRPYPVAELESVEVWTGSAFTAQSLSTYLLVKGRPAAAYLTDGVPAPLPARTRAGVVVTFTAGFGDDSTEMPEDIKQACLLLVAHWYANREASISSKTGFGVSAELTRGVSDLLAPYRSPRLI